MNKMEPLKSMEHYVYSTANHGMGLKFNRNLISERYWSNILNILMIEVLEEYKGVKYILQEEVRDEINDRINI